MNGLDSSLLHKIAARVGTPFWVYEAAKLRERIRMIQEITDSPHVQARYAMKALSATKVLQEMKAAGIWIDSVSGNEVLRAMHAGFPGGKTPPQICFTADVFRDNALQVILDNDILPNAGSPGMIAQLAAAGYRGAVSLRVNPGFGHGHVNSCDTGGPSSKHGIWFEDLFTVVNAANEAGMRITMIHAHIGSGPKFEELHDNLKRLAEEFAQFVPHCPDLEAVSLGGGIPHDYRNPDATYPVETLKALFRSSQEAVSRAAGREIRLEIEPGRFYVAPSGTLVGKVSDVKQTQTNEKGPGVTFALIDAGFVDLVRPAMYGSYHRIEVVGKQGQPTEPLVVAGPMCESGDVFTRDDAELLQPRELPRPEAGDLMTLHDAGAYGAAMSSNYNSLGRAPQVWVEEDGSVELISRRETVEDLLRCETAEQLW